MVQSQRIRTWRERFGAELFDSVLPFWERHGPDPERGGFLHYLDRAGRPIAWRKSGWLEGRTAWCFAWLYTQHEQRPEWLSLSRTAAEFVRDAVIDPDDGRCYFQVTRDGRPLRKRRYLFTEVFAAMGLAEYGAASGEAWAVERARRLAELVEELLATPGALSPKYESDQWRMRDHSIVMIRVNLYQQFRRLFGCEEYTQRIDRLVAELFRYFVHEEKQALLESVWEDGSCHDSPEGRTVNPGHAIETAWFLLEEARTRGNTALRDRAVEILDWSLALGWDAEYGGLYSFVDVDGNPAHQVEWDMKYWWPHTEALYATLLAYAETSREDYWDWFERIADYSFRHFPDPQHGEWFGYLHRDGSVSLTVKGNDWKGPFHVPRALFLVWRLLGELGEGATA
jgi:N-acylglucosamine 2-epimerase